MAFVLADAVDSRLEFVSPQFPDPKSNQKPAFAYTLLLNKPFPQLSEFTMSMFLNPVPGSQATRQCVFSYKRTSIK